MDRRTEVATAIPARTIDRVENESFTNLALLWGTMMIVLSLFDISPGTSSARRESAFCGN
jgi:hypothetical protein